MPKKPTVPFGSIIFGKDGLVRSDIRQLTSVKSEQELHVASEFVRRWSSLSGVVASVVPLREYDHDFLIDTGPDKIEVQLTEIVRLEYSDQISRDDFVAGKLRPNVHMQISTDAFLEIDAERQNNILIKKLAAKQAKNYQKPQVGKLWLCAWTLESLLAPTYLAGGQLHKEPWTIRAEHYAAENGIEPFDEFWCFAVGLNPYRVWPSESDSDSD